MNGVYWEEDGFYENVVSGEDFGGGDGYGVALTSLYEPTDALRFKLRLSWTDDEYEPGAVAVLNDRTVEVPVPEDASAVTDETEATLLPRVGSASGLEVRSSEDPLTGGDYPGNTLEVFRGSLVASWELENITLSSYTGYTDADMSQRYDLDRQAQGRPDTFLGHGDVDTFGNTEQISQELRLVTGWDDAGVQFTLGALYWEEERDDFSRNVGATCWVSAACFADGFDSWQSLYAAVMGVSADFRNPIDTETEHYSVYAMLEWDISERFRFTVEDRLVWEDFSTTLFLGSSCVHAWPLGPDFRRNVGCIPGEETSGDTESDYQTPKFTLEWLPADELMVYVSAAKGQKPAGISLLTLPLPFPIPLDPYFFAPEKMWSYELGAKYTASGELGDLLFNSAIFYQDYTDKQTNTQQDINGFLVGVVTNASAAEAAGLELEARWDTPLDGLSLGAAYTYLDTEYDDFRDATRSVGRIAIAGTCGTVVDVGGRPHCELDLSGNELELAPEHSLVLTGTYRRPIGSRGWELIVDGNLNYLDERFTSADNFTLLDDHWLADLRLGLRGDQWQVLAYVENLFDDDTITSSGGNIDLAEGYVDSGLLAPPGLPTGFLPRPRIFGVRVQLDY